MKKFFHIETLGCKVNQYDTQLLREQLIAGGYIESPSENLPTNNGDLIVINTCTVTGRADQKCRNMIRRLVRVKGGANVVVTGCYVDGDREGLRKIPGIDALLCNNEKRDILRLLDGVSSAAASNTISYFESRTRAFLKIQDGCDQFCSYCIVPHVRGRSRSKEPAVVVKEAKDILSNGYKEIVITGVHLGDYGRGLESAAALDDVVSAISEIDGKFRIRISSIEPMNLGPRMIKRLSKIEKLCPHFHIPLQSGDDGVLKRMNRRYTSAEFRKITEAVKDNFDDAAISTDIIVGFPGESAAEFQNSVKSVRDIGFSKVHIFPFSPRKGTKASAFKDKVAPGEIKKRVTELESAAGEAALHCKIQMVGKTKEVLVEDKSDGPYLNGFTDNYQPVVFQGDELLKNSFVNVSIEGALKDILLGSKL